MYQIFHHRSGLTSWGIRVLQNEGLSSMTEILKQKSREEDIAEKKHAPLATIASGIIIPDTLLRKA